MSIDIDYNFGTIQREINREKINETKIKNLILEINKYIEFITDQNKSYTLTINSTQMQQELLELINLIEENEFLTLIIKNVDLDIPLSKLIGSLKIGKIKLEDTSLPEEKIILNTELEIATSRISYKRLQLESNKAITIHSSSTQPLSLNKCHAPKIILKISNPVLNLLKTDHLNVINAKELKIEKSEIKKLRISPSIDEIEIDNIINNIIIEIPTTPGRPETTNFFRISNSQFTLEIKNSHIFENVFIKNCGKKDSQVVFASTNVDYIKNFHIENSYFNKFEIVNSNKFSSSFIVTNSIFKNSISFIGTHISPAFDICRKSKLGITDKNAANNYCDLKNKLSNLHKDRLSFYISSLEHNASHLTLKERGYGNLEFLSSFFSRCFNNYGDSLIKPLNHLLFLFFVGSILNIFILDQFSNIEDGYFNFTKVHSQNNTPSVVLLDSAHIFLKSIYISAMATLGPLGFLSKTMNSFSMGIFLGLTFSIQRILSTIYLYLIVMWLKKVFRQI